MGPRKRKKKETGRGWGSGRGDSDVRGTGIKNEKDSGQELQGALEDQRSTSGDRKWFFSFFLLQFLKVIVLQVQVLTLAHAPPLSHTHTLSLHLWHLAMLLHSGCHRRTTHTDPPRPHIVMWQRRLRGCCHLIRLGWVAHRGRAAASIRLDGNSCGRAFSLHTCTHFLFYRNVKLYTLPLSNHTYTHTRTLTHDQLISANNVFLLMMMSA